MKATVNFMGMTPDPISSTDAAMEFGQAPTTAETLRAMADSVKGGHEAAMFAMILRRAAKELDGKSVIPHKPDWKDAPYWAKYLAMDDDREWFWFSDMPEYDRAPGKWGCDWAQRLCATVPHDASQTLEWRPED